MPHAGWALPLTPDTTELETLGSRDPVHCLDCDDALHFGPRRVSPTKLRRSIKHFSWIADLTRSRIADEGSAELSKAMLKELQEIWPVVSETAPVEISDDPVGNCLTTTFTFEICDGWKSGSNGGLSFTIADQILPRELIPLPGAPRLTDILVWRPRKLTRRVRMVMPCKWNGNGWLRVRETSSLSFMDRVTINGKIIESSRELIIKAWSVPAAEAVGYSELVGMIHQNLLNVFAGEWFGRIGPFLKNRVLALVIVVFCLFLVLLGISHLSHLPSPERGGPGSADLPRGTRANPFRPLPFPEEGARAPGTPFPPR
jgi:hypothetical protein